MSRRKAPPILNLEEILLRPVNVKVNGVQVKMEPFKAQFVQCADAALRGDVKACNRFIRWCLRDGLIAPIEAYDDHQYVVTIPKDWDRNEFMTMYEKHGPPPWLGLRDGLTAADRERRFGASRRSRGARDGE